MASGTRYINNERQMTSLGSQADEGTKQKSGAERYESAGTYAGL